MAAGVGMDGSWRTAVVGPDPAISNDFLSRTLQKHTKSMVFIGFFIDLASRSLEKAVQIDGFYRFFEFCSF